MTAEFLGLLNLANAEDLSDATQGDLDTWETVRDQINQRFEQAIQVGGGGDEVQDTISPNVTSA